MVVGTHFTFTDLPTVVVVAASPAQHTIILPTTLWAEPQQPRLAVSETFKSLRDSPGRPATSPIREPRPESTRLEIGHSGCRRRAPANTVSAGRRASLRWIVTYPR
jgi:hypothetical protein